MLIVCVHAMAPMCCPVYKSVAVTDMFSEADDS